MERKYLLLAILFIHCWSGVAYPLPQGGDVVAGGAAMEQNNTSLTITQTTDRAIINWGQFDIAAQEHVLFAQPGHDAVTLNRVIGNDPSSILGNLTANGHIFLVNPNGIFFGPNAKLDVAGLIATTLDIHDNDFLSGNDQFQGTGMDRGAVVNEGEIKVSDGGFVFFIAPSVTNAGMIAAPGGEVVLSARGAIDPLSLMVNQSGMIEAKSLVNEGGIIRLIADTGTVIQGGILDVSAKEAVGNGGEITLFGREADVSGTLLARGGDGGGNGGAIEVSGSQYLRLDGVVNASAVNGIAGSLLLDPKDIIIGGQNATMRAANITDTTNNGTGVILRAENDITLNEPIITGGDPLQDGGALTFEAGRSILLNAGITSDNAPISLTANAPVGGARDPGPASITMVHGTTLDAGRAIIEITLAAGESGAITVDNLVTTSNIKIVNNGSSPSSHILMADPSSLIHAASVAFNIGGGGSVGTALSPIRIDVSNVEARSGEGGIFLTSTGGVIVGGAALADNNVSGITSLGKVTLSVAGMLTVNESITTNAPITLRADRMVLEAGTITAGAGRVTLMPETSGRAINLGSEGDEKDALALSDKEMDRITTSGTLQIGGSETGAIEISAPITTANVKTLTLQGSGVTAEKGYLIEEELLIKSVGIVALTHSLNDVNTISADVTGAGKTIHIIDRDDLSVGAVDTEVGIQTNHGAVTLTTQTGHLTLRDDIAVGTAAVSLTAGGKESRITNNADILGGTIALTADQIELANGSTIDGGAGRVTLQSDQSGRPIDLGLIGDPENILALSDSELDTIKTTGTLQIGDSNTGAIAVSGPINTSGVQTVTLIGQSVTQTQPIVEENLRIDSGGAVVLINPNNDVGTLTANVTGPGDPFNFTDANRVELGTVDGATGITTNGGLRHIDAQLSLAETIEGHLWANYLPIGEGALNRFHLEVLPKDFVVLPENPCKLDELLSNEFGLHEGC